MASPWQTKLMASSKFTEEVRNAVLEALRINPSIPSAASKAGIHANTLRNWLAEGEQGNLEFAAFALDAQDARMSMKDAVVASLFKIATDEMHPQATKAAHQLLTNLYPAEFANVRHTVAHQAEKQPALDLSRLPQEELRAFHRTLKRLRSEADPEPEQPVTVIEALEAEAGQENSKIQDAN